MNGPELWDKILAQMPEGSIIAGGAVRDFFLGVEPKDIDVFAPMTPLVEVPLIESVDPSAFDFTLLEPCIGPRRGLYRIDNRYERLEEYQALDGIACISCGEAFGVKVDLIEMVSTELDGHELIKTFDFGITRCFYDGRLCWDTPEALFDRDNKTVTMFLSDRRERALKRFDRFNSRMGGQYHLVELETVA